MKSIQAKIFYILTLFALVFTCLCPNTDKGYSRVYAANNDTSLDKTAVLDDLDLDAMTLPEANDDNLFVVSFVEYCFAYNKDYNGNFGLYVYVYNPSSETITVVANGSENKITLGVEYEGEEVKAYDKFSLRCLSVSDDGRFIKYKIVDAESAVTGETIMTRLLRQRLQRIYDVSEIEIMRGYGEIPKSSAVGTRYTYTGFAQGYGQNADAGSTLECYRSESNVVSLDVHATQYRLDGNNGKNIYTQDSLHSVYFTVPNEASEKFGEMTAVHAQWLDAVLKPILVTGNQDAYNAILPYLGQDLGEGGHNSDLGLIYLGACEVKAFTASYSHQFGFSYNAPVDNNGRMILNGASLTGSVTNLSAGNDRRSYYGNSINPLYIMFDAGTGLNSADGYRPPADGEGSLTEKVQQATTKFGGELVDGRYSRVLFENVAEEKIDARIKSTDEFDIRNVDIDKVEWWEAIFGIQFGDKVDETTLDRFVGVKAIEPVTAGMVGGSREEVCKRLKIGLQDYEAFIDYYDKNKNNGTVYLFRYKVSDYVSEEATLFKKDTGWGKVDTNAYFFQTAVDIGFDIIDITLTNEEGDHVLGVASTPIDVFPTPTPPLITTDDSDFNLWKELLFWLKMIVGIILVVLLVVAVCVVFPPVGAALLYVVVLPFKGLAWLGKKINSVFHKKE